MSTANAHAPITIDEPGLFRLAEAGYRWTEGQAGLVRYRWLLPPGWVCAADLPPRERNPIEALMGVGDWGGQFTAVLGLLRGFEAHPRELLTRNAAPGATTTLFSSRSGPVAERIERRNGRLTVTTAHAFSAAGEPYRFLISAVAREDSADARSVLRTVGTALSLADGLDSLRLGRLHA